MANNASSSQYWKYNDARKDYYHAEWREGSWAYTWRSALNTPRTTFVDPGMEQPPQPFDPYGAQSRTSGAHVQASSPPAGAIAMTQAFKRLSVTESQPPNAHMQRRETHGQRATAYHPARSPSVVIEPNRTIGPQVQSAGFAQSKYYNHQAHGQLSASNVGYGDSQGRTPTSVQGVGRTAGKLSAQDLGYQPPWPSTSSSMGAFDAEQMAQAQRASQMSYHRESRGDGPSHAAYPSNTSYPVQQTHTLLSDGLPVALRTEKLNPKEFKQITHGRRKFFVVGKVFMMLYIENAGETADRAGPGGTNFTTVAHGEVAHHQFRRFVVVKEMSDQNFCYCCPITTYGGRATTKPGVDQTSHTIVYSGKTPPEKLSEETKMNKEPLRINLCSPDDKLDSRSRINLGREHPIDHNVKVKNIGKIDERSLPKLVQYRRAVRDR
ncbi:hypothetical protein MMC29_005250 [Sticta canariensis]|nr:hypothetical protein [Sticta canariensis]